MASIVKGRDKMLEAFGFKTGVKRVQLSQNDVRVVKEAIGIMEKAAQLCYKAEELNEDSIVDNPFAVAGIELSCALEVAETK